MEHDFWHTRWQENRIGFHLPDINDRLLEHHASLAMIENETVFIPLCGKTHDIKFFIEQGHDVIANELSPLAVTDFFKENALEFKQETRSPFVLYQADQLRFYQGDFFKLEQTDLAKVSIVYDRAALVAMPKEMRQQYAKKLIQTLPQKVKILLVTLEYDQNLKQGPPFSVIENEVFQLYQADFKISCLAEDDTEKKQRSASSQGLKMVEKTYLLER